MSYRLRAGEQSSKYQPGQRVSADYASRYPHKVAKVRRRRKPPVPPLPPPEVSRIAEWEVTAVWKTRKGKHSQTSDVTFRVRVLDPKLVATGESVRKAVWAAVVHGRELESYEIQGINWRNVEQIGRRTVEREYGYEPWEPTWAETVAATQKIVRGTGLAKLRVAPVED
ncbi:MAG: hypothetical protein ACREA0_10230 [bacterium]